MHLRGIGPLQLTRSMSTTKTVEGGVTPKLLALGVIRFFLRLGPVLHVNPLVGVVVGVTLGSAQEATVLCTKPSALAGHKPTWLVNRY